LTRTINDTFSKHLSSRLEGSAVGQLSQGKVPWASMMVVIWMLPLVFSFVIILAQFDPSRVSINLMNTASVLAPLNISPMSMHLTTIVFFVFSQSSLA
jgi:hypothetical protein